MPVPYGEAGIFLCLFHGPDVKEFCLTVHALSYIIKPVGDRMSLENIVRKGDLLDCYGALLTARQRECLDLYYNENLSLGEIAEHFHISRQAVHDAMRHGEEQLMAYESALHMEESRTARKAAAEALARLVKPERAAEAEKWLRILCE